MLLLFVVLGFTGFAIGSFLTVLIRRLETGETIVWGRSRCVQCRKTLRWFELLPVLSFLAQGGQCRWCGNSIPRLYPLIELATAALLMGVGWAATQSLLPIPEFFPESPAGGLDFGTLGRAITSFFYYGFFALMAVAVSFYDFEHRVIPRVLIWPLILIGFGAKVFGGFASGELTGLLFGGGVALAAFLVFWSLWFFSNGRAMGRGDADVALAIALYLEPAVAVSGFLLAFWIGAIGAILLVACSRLHWKSQLPFAPFLFGGALAAIFFSEPIQHFIMLW